MKRILLSAPDISGRELDLVKQVFDENFIAPAGPMLTQFESDMCKYTGASYAVALSSGTAALHLALRCSGIGQGDEVWTSSMTFIGGVSPITYQSATPIFFDLSEEDWLLDLDLVEEQLVRANNRNELPKAIIPTDLYGQACDLKRLCDLGKRYGVKIISDSAEAVGSFRNNKHAGIEADAMILSFNGNKIISSSGGGMLLSANKNLIEHARKLSTQARENVEHYEHEEIGYNYRMSAVSAAIGVGQLEQIEQKVARRRTLFNQYRDAFAGYDFIETMPEPEVCRSTRWLTCIRFNGKNGDTICSDVKAECASQDIEVRSMWKPMHMQPVFKGSTFFGRGFCETLFRTGICLPSGSGMSDEDQARVIDAVVSAVKRHQ